MLKVWRKKNNKRILFCLLYDLYQSGPDIVIHHDQDVLDKMNDWSREQHTKSGLVELIRQSQISLFDAETMVIEFIKRYCPSGTGIPAGNSVFVDRWQVLLLVLE